MSDRVVVLVPYRPDGGSRDRVWLWVRRWIAANYDFPVFVGDSVGERFSRSAARNDAARQAGDWDVAVLHDADTFAHSDAVRSAVAAARASRAMVVAGDAHMYCDRASSERILSSFDASFARPNSFDDRGVYEKPCSGVFAVSRDLWDATGGYVEALHGWGFEDLVFLQCCGLFGGGNAWVDGHITLHLWHEPSPSSSDTAVNRDVWQRLTQFRRRRDVPGARAYLESLGHWVP